MRMLTVALCAAAGVFAGCRYSDVAAAWPAMDVKRMQFAEHTPSSFRVLVERPMLSGEKAAQQGALDEWIAEVASFGKYSNVTAEVVLDNMLAGWHEVVEEQRRETEGEPWQMEALSHWYFDLQAEITFADDGYLAYQTCLDEYEGWMHPFRNFSWGVWSFSLGRPLAPEDIFRPECMPQVIALVKDDMAYDHNCTNFAQYAETRLIDDFTELPKNFTLDDRGIKFIFNAYEIACYAEGDIRGFVSWRDLLPYLRPDFTPPKR